MKDEARSITQPVNQMLLEALKELLAVHTGPKINCETQSYKAVVKARAAIEQAERTTP